MYFAMNTFTMGFETAFRTGQGLYCLLTSLIHTAGTPHNKFQVSCPRVCAEQLRLSDVQTDCAVDAGIAGAVTSDVTSQDKCNVVGC